MVSCTDDIDVQMSLNSLKAYWTVPDNIQPYTTDAFISIAYFLKKYSIKNRVKKRNLCYSNKYSD
jgi:hypothetical protein